MPTKYHNREKTKTVLSIAAFVASLVIGFIAIFLPPLGIIDTSILIYTAQLLLFVAAILGVNLTFTGHGSSAQFKKEDEE